MVGNNTDIQHMNYICNNRKEKKHSALNKKQREISQQMLSFSEVLFNLRKLQGDRTDNFMVRIKINTKYWIWFICGHGVSNNVS